jgi:hypothetical protein
LNADPDPDPTTQINADPCGSGSGYGSGSETLQNTPLELKKLTRQNWLSVSVRYGTKVLLTK